MTSQCLMVTLVAGQAERMNAFTSQLQFTTELHHISLFSQIQPNDQRRAFVTLICFLLQMVTIDLYYLYFSTTTLINIGDVCKEEA